MSLPIPTPEERELWRAGSKSKAFEAIVSRALCDKMAAYRAFTAPGWHVEAESVLADYHGTKVLGCLLALILTACGAQEVTCETRCGLRMLGGLPSSSGYEPHSPPWTCESLQFVEDGMLEELSQVDDGRFTDVCGALGSFSFEVAPTPVFNSAYHGRVSGLARCESRHAVIGNSPPDRSSLPHEMAHLIQDCQPESCDSPGSDPEHACWRSGGIYAAAEASNLYAWQTMPIEWLVEVLEVSP